MIIFFFIVSVTVISIWTLTIAVERCFCAYCWIWRWRNTNRWYLVYCNFSSGILVRGKKFYKLLNRYVYR